jgi:hypothetical protein
MAIGGARDINLIGDEFHGDERRVALQRPFGDFDRLDGEEIGLVPLLSGFPLADRLREGGEDGIAQERLQGGRVAFGKGVDDDLESGAGALEEMLFIEGAVGGLERGEARCAGRLGRWRRDLSTRRQGHDILARGIGRAERLAAPLRSGATAEDAPQAQDEKPGDHGQDENLQVLSAIAAHRHPRLETGSSPP